MGAAEQLPSHAAQQASQGLLNFVARHTPVDEFERLLDAAIKTFRGASPPLDVDALSHEELINAELLLREDLLRHRDEYPTLGPLVKLLAPHRLAEWTAALDAELARVRELYELVEDQIDGREGADAYASDARVSFDEMNRRLGISG